MLVSVRMLNQQAYRDMDGALTDDLSTLTAVELTYHNDLFVKLVPVQLQVASVDVGQVYAASYARPMQGRLLKEWSASIEADRMTRIRDAIRIGYVENQTVTQIVQRIRGTQAKGYSDGIIEIDRRNAESIVRTAVSHTAAFARDRFYQSNADLVKGIVWCSTLDTRTSPICIARSGKRYDTKHKPIGHSFPWLGGPGMAHWGCRSSSTPILKGLDEILGIDGLGEFTPTTRASMDGQVPADMTYAQWLAKQSAARQDEVLGPTRGAMLRSGELKVDRFFNDKGRFLTLDELAARS
jgi:SPP1 gp7 family putative phage head morphogenesis protein